MASQICWKEKRTPAERDAQEQITQLWYQLDPQDGAISVPSMLHLRQLTAVPVRRKPKEHASTDILRRQQNCLHGRYNHYCFLAHPGELSGSLMDYSSLCMYLLGWQAP